MCFSLSERKQQQQQHQNEKRCTLILFIYSFVLFCFLFVFMRLATIICVTIRIFSSHSLFFSLSRFRFSCLTHWSLKTNKQKIGWMERCALSRSVTPFTTTNKQPTQKSNIRLFSMFVQIYVDLFFVFVFFRVRLEEFHPKGRQRRRRRYLI